MRKFAWFALYFILVQGFNAYAQTFDPTSIRVIPYATGPEQPGNEDSLHIWVMEIFHGGGGKIIDSTIQFIGASDLQFGHYQRGVDFSAHCDEYNSTEDCADEGLIISTGDVMSAVAPGPPKLPNVGNRSEAFDAPNFPYDYGDPDLFSMYEKKYPPIFGQRPIQMGDVAFLQFDYIPYGDEISMRYMYASEEYPNDMDRDNDVDLTDGSQRYDLLGVFIETPGYTAGRAENRATFPEDEIFPQNPPDNWITIESVNENNFPEYFIKNNTPPPLGAGPPLMVGTEFDGITQPKNALVARKKFPRGCAKQTIKIAIADYEYEDPVNPERFSFSNNSAVFLTKGSFVGGEKMPGWTVDYHYTHPNPNFEGKLIEGGCNELLITYSLEYVASNMDPYFITFKLVPGTWDPNVKVAYEHDGSQITNDTIVFQPGDSVITIRLSAIDLTKDSNPLEFTYQRDPCDRDPDIPGLEYKFKGRIPIQLINNDPIEVINNPIYTAYCKETIPITKTDMLSVIDGGVVPLTVRWPQGTLPFPETYYHTVNNSPDYVPVIIDDLCDNSDTISVMIINNDIDLNEIPPLSFCKPGMSQEVVATWGSNSDFPGYSFVSNLTTWSNITDVPPTALGTGNPFVIHYDNDYLESEWYAAFSVTDVCGNDADGTFKVDQTGKLDIGDDKYICKGESVDLINFTPVWQDDPNNYIWYTKSSPTDSTTVGTGSSITVTPMDTTMYYLYIYDKCETKQIDSLIVFVDHFLPQITINPSTAEVCPGEEVILTANEASSYLWTPGFDTTNQVTVIKYTPDKYQYILTATSPAGHCKDKRDTAYFEVFHQPTALFAFDPPANACTGETIQFTYGIDPNSVDQFQWDFGDGNTSTLQNPTHVYNMPNIYTVKLHVQEYICEHDSSMPIVVDPLPTPNFTFDPDPPYGCVPLTVNFTDASQDLAPGATFFWEFGDGKTSTVKNPQNEYIAAGTYGVTLTVSNTARCLATTSKPNIIQVNPNPTALFEADPWLTTMDAPEIQFWNLSESDSAIILYDWTFGGEGSSIEENPTHTFTKPGDSIPVIFIIETANGCLDTIIGKVGVTEFVRLFIPNAFTPNGDGVDDKFEIKGTPVTDWNLYIYDRWGAQIWSTHNFETQWDGTDRSGNPVPVGTYIYQITGTDYRLEPIGEKGQVTVVR